MNNNGIPEQYARKLTKEEVNQLPLRRWKGPIHLVPGDIPGAEAAARLREERILGFDTETRPAFRKGVSYRPSLVQLAGSGQVFLFQLARMDSLEPLAGLLGDGTILKVGVGLDHDVRQLQEVFPFEPGGFLDLGVVAENAGMESRGLRSMAAALFGFRISKRAQCSNWEEGDLQPYQVHYAATDAWVSREIYLTMANLGIVDGSPGSATQRRGRRVTLDGTAPPGP
ncbi:MAG: 3'-5' exonuclease domain-containing protein 2 [Magnetococcales bacterium]|nr:3'-5' exonuclease domain-containing protein 2 [Magnetococcales bacterium]